MIGDDSVTGNGQLVGQAKGAVQWFPILQLPTTAQRPQPNPCIQVQSCSAKLRAVRPSLMNSRSALYCFNLALWLQVSASAHGQRVGQAQGAIGQPFALQVPNANLWSPDNPFLYDLEVQLLGGQQAVVSKLSLLTTPVSNLACLEVCHWLKSRKCG